MNERKTPIEAWDEFYEWVRKQPEWKIYSRAEKEKVYDANTARKGQRKFKLDARRIANIIEKFAPGRYEFHEGEPYFIRKG